MMDTSVRPNILYLQQKVMQCITWKMMYHTHTKVHFRDDRYSIAEEFRSLVTSSIIMQKITCEKYTLSPKGQCIAIYSRLKVWVQLQLGWFIMPILHYPAAFKAYILFCMDSSLLDGRTYSSKLQKNAKETHFVSYYHLMLTLLTKSLLVLLDRIL